MRLNKRLGAAVSVVALAGAVTGGAAGASGAVGATTATTGGIWGSVQEVPGLAALTSTPGGHNPSDVRALGCSTLGNCAAVGDYGSPVSGDTVPFVATEVNGTWGTQPLTGLPAMAAATTSTLTNISCGAPDFCTAVGTYFDTGDILHVFAVTETNGTWSTPVVLEAPGLGNVQSFGFSGLSCPTMGECTLVGSYTPPGAVPVPFTADESGGHWASLQPLAGLANLAPSSASPVTGGLTSLSCGAPGDCTAGGTYQYSNSLYGAVQQPFIVSESGHSWGEPQLIPGIASVSASGQGDEAYQNEVTSVSCPDAGDCAVAGIFFPELNADGLFFTLDEAGGTWGQAKALSLPSGDFTDGPVPFVSCRSAGNCVIAAKVGNEPGQSSSGSSAVVTAAESSSGAWGAATAIPGIAAGDESQIDNLTCVPNGDCTVLGLYYPGGTNPNEIFSATSAAGGPMGAAQPVASSGIVTPDGSQLICPQNGHCTVMYNGIDAIVGQPGTYDGLSVPELVTQAPAAAITLTASKPTVSYGDEEAETLTATVTSPSGGTPTGSVTVNSGSATVCTITLASGTGTCSLAASQFPPGTVQQLSATYNGSVDFAASVSAKVALTVVPPSSLYVPAGPVRILDTRYGTGGYRGPVQGGHAIRLQVTGRNGVPASGVTAVVLNVTAVGPTAASHVTVYPDGMALPVASNLNFTRGQTVPNLVMVPVGADGKVDLYNNSGSVNLIADLAGYYLN